MNYDEMDALLGGYEAGDTVTLTVWPRYYDARGNARSSTRGAGYRR